MPFKMMNPLKQMDTTAMKTVQKSAVKKLSPNQEKLDKNKSGDLDSQDFKMLRSSNKRQPSGVNYMDGSKSPAKAERGEFLKQVVGDVSKIAGGVSDMLKKAKDAFYKKREESLEKARTQAEKDKVLKNLSNSKLAATLERIRKENKEGAESKTEVRSESKTEVRSGSRTEGGQKSLKEINAAKKKAAEAKAAAAAAAAAEKAAKTGPDKKITYSQAWDKMTDAAKGKYESKADFIKAAKAYNVKIGKTKKPTAIIPKTETETKTGTGTVTNANNISGRTGIDNTADGILKRAKEREKAAKKAAEEKAAADLKAAEKAKKNKKLTPKEKRKAERNIKAQEKANKKIRKGGGQQIKVDEKNTTATAADRRKLKQGAKRLEEKLSLKRIELEGNKPKKKKDKNKTEDKKKKDKKKNGKGAGNKIVSKQNRQM